VAHDSNDEPELLEISDESFRGTGGTAPKQNKRAKSFGKQPDPIETSDDGGSADDELDEKLRIPTTGCVRQRESSSDEDGDLPDIDSMLAPIINKKSSATSDSIPLTKMGSRRWPCPANVYIVQEKYKCPRTTFATAKDARNHCLAFYLYIPSQEEQYDCGAAGALANACRRPGCAYFFTNINTRNMDANWRLGVSLADKTRETPKWVNDVARFVISRRAASQKDLSH
jgi:hypothetical protein